MAEQRWWAGEAAERFWLEATDREDIGSDLPAPLRDGGGRDNWRYTLFKEAREGDIVLHYDGKASAITAWSTVAGPARSQPIVWAARGSYARERGVQPVEVEGYSMPLRNFTPLSTAITLPAIRDQKSGLVTLIRVPQETHKGPLYFPFELSNRPVRPMQGYAFKLPASFLSLFGLDELFLPLRALLISSDRDEVRKHLDV